MADLDRSLITAIEDRGEKNFKAQASFLLQLVKINSANPGIDVGRKVTVEAELARLLRQKLRLLGVRTRYWRLRSGRPNLVGIWGPLRARKNLMLVGHMDTAPIPKTHRCQIREGKIYGPGVLDMKASLAMYLYALKALRDLKLEPEGKLRFAFVADGKA